MGMSCIYIYNEENNNVWRQFRTHVLYQVSHPISIDCTCDDNVINIWSSQAQFAPSEQKLRSPASTAEKGFMFGSGEDDFYSYKNKQTISFVFL